MERLSADMIRGTKKLIRNEEFHTRRFFFFYGTQHRFVFNQDGTLRLDNDNQPIPTTTGQ